jgi:hypothetical protein
MTLFVLELALEMLAHSAVGMSIAGNMGLNVARGKPI